MTKFAFISVILFCVWLTTLPCKMSGLDLNDLAQDFVLEKKRIIIPEYPLAFNPSIVRWRGKLLLSFRVPINANTTWHSQIGLVWLDEDFDPISKPQLLNTRAKYPLHPSKSEDARLFKVGEALYIIYNDNEEFYDYGLRRMYYSELIYDGREFSIDPEIIQTYEGATQDRWEKNWVPFDYCGNMLLAYTIVPHRIFVPLFGLGTCQTISSTRSRFQWSWGADRIFGGTPALKVDDQYLAFFHSSIPMASLQSGYYKTWHYFVGAYTFNGEMPFAITHVSSIPIMGKGLYDNPVIYKRVIFPGSFIFDDQHIWISYGREDSESWILKLDKKGLLNSLTPVAEISEEN